MAFMNKHSKDVSSTIDCSAVCPNIASSESQVKNARDIPSTLAENKSDPDLLSVVLSTISVYFICASFIFFIHMIWSSIFQSRRLNPPEKSYPNKRNGLIPLTTSIESEGSGVSKLNNIVENHKKNIQAPGPCQNISNLDSRDKYTDIFIDSAEYDTGTNSICNAFNRLMGITETKLMPKSALDGPIDKAEKLSSTSKNDDESSTATPCNVQKSHSNGKLECESQPINPCIPILPSPIVQSDKGDYTDNLNISASNNKEVKIDNEAKEFSNINFVNNQGDNFSPKFENDSEDIFTQQENNKKYYIRCINRIRNIKNKFSKYRKNFQSPIPQSQEDFQNININSVEDPLTLLDQNNLSLCKNINNVTEEQRVKNVTKRHATNSNQAIKNEANSSCILNSKDTRNVIVAFNEEQNSSAKVHANSTCETQAIKNEANSSCVLNSKDTQNVIVAFNEEQNSLAKVHANSTCETNVFPLMKDLQGKNSPNLYTPVTDSNSNTFPQNNNGVVQNIIQQASCKTLFVETAINAQGKQVNYQPVITQAQSKNNNFTNSIVTATNLCPIPADTTTALFKTCSKPESLQQKELGANSSENSNPCQKSVNSNLSDIDTNSSDKKPSFSDASNLKKKDSCQKDVHFISPIAVEMSPKKSNSSSYALDNKKTETRFESLINNPLHLDTSNDKKESCFLLSPVSSANINSEANDDHKSVKKAEQVLALESSTNLNTNDQDGFNPIQNFKREGNISKNTLLNLADSIKCDNIQTTITPRSLKPPNLCQNETSDSHCLLPISAKTNAEKCQNDTKSTCTFRATSPMGHQGGFEKNMSQGKIQSQYESFKAISEAFKAEYNTQIDGGIYVFKGKCPTLNQKNDLTSNNKQIKKSSSFTFPKLDTETKQNEAEEEPLPLNNTKISDDITVKGKNNSNSIEKTTDKTVVTSNVESKCDKSLESLAQKKHISKTKSKTKLKKKSNRSTPNENIDEQDNSTKAVVAHSKANNVTVAARIKKNSEAVLAKKVEQTTINKNTFENSVLSEKIEETTRFFQHNLHLYPTSVITKKIKEQTELYVQNLNEHEKAILLKNIEQFEKIKRYEYEETSRVNTSTSQQSVNQNTQKNCINSTCTTADTDAKCNIIKPTEQKESSCRSPVERSVASLSSTTVNSNATTTSLKASNSKERVPSTAAVPSQKNSTNAKASNSNNDVPLKATNSKTALNRKSSKGKATTIPSKTCSNCMKRIEVRNTSEDSNANTCFKNTISPKLKICTNCLNNTDAVLPVTKRHNAITNGSSKIYVPEGLASNSNINEENMKNTNYKICEEQNLNKFVLLTVDAKSKNKTKRGVKKTNMNQKQKQVLTPPEQSIDGLIFLLSKVNAYFTPSTKRKYGVVKAVLEEIISCVADRFLKHMEFTLNNRKIEERKWKVAAIKISNEVCSPWKGENAIKLLLINQLEKLAKLNNEEANKRNIPYQRNIITATLKQKIEMLLLTEASLTKYIWYELKAVKSGEELLQAVRSVSDPCVRSLFCLYKELLISKIYIDNLSKGITSLVDEVKNLTGVGVLEEQKQRKVIITLFDEPEVEKLVFKRIKSNILHNVINSSLKEMERLSTSMTAKYLLDTGSPQFYPNIYTGNVVSNTTKSSENPKNKISPNNTTEKEVKDCNQQCLKKRDSLILNKRKIRLMQFICEDDSTVIYNPKYTIRQHKNDAFGLSKCQYLSNLRSFARVKTLDRYKMKKRSKTPNEYNQCDHVDSLENVSLVFKFEKYLRTIGCQTNDPYEEVVSQCADMDIGVEFTLVCQRSLYQWNKGKKSGKKKFSVQSVQTDPIKPIQIFGALPPELYGIFRNRKRDSQSPEHTRAPIPVDMMEYVASTTNYKKKKPNLAPIVKQPVIPKKECKKVFKDGKKAKKKAEEVVTANSQKNKKGKPKYGYVNKQR